MKSLKQSSAELGTPLQTLPLVLSLLTVEVKPQPVWVGRGKGRAVARRTQARLDGRWGTRVWFFSWLED